MKDNFYVCLYCGTLQTFDGSQVGSEPRKSSAAAKRDIAAEYRTACEKMSAAKTSADYKAAAEMFGKISDYQNAAELMAECHQKAKALQIEERYTSACNMMKEQNIALKLLIVIAVAILFSEFYLRFLGVKIVECYQHYAKEDTRRRCLCVPSCSEYAILCLKKFILIKALTKIRKRLYVTCKGGDYIIDWP